MDNEKNLIIRSSSAEYLTFIAANGDDEKNIEMRYENENIWLTQKMLAALYDVEVSTINEHIAKIYADSELEQSATIRNFRIVQTEGNRQVERSEFEKYCIVQDKLFESDFDKLLAKNEVL